ncbi:MAG: DNA topoisomerase I, partial [Candidatus Sericytochromatia bacterium]|nr:DNA topoisomerase I [Candidatus Sericytochromatia bacterium]
VKKLEEMGIGRPSTYAPTISTIVKREYVVKESREGKDRKYKEIILKNKKIVTNENTEITGVEKNKLFPTNIGVIVNDFLTEYFDDIVNYSFTANVEKEFDDIANGKKKWNNMIEDFYGDFHSKVETAANIDRSEINSSRELGFDPVSGKKIITRLAKFGAIVQLGEVTPEEKPKYGRLKKSQFIDTITLEEALELFKLPREVGMFEEKPMVVAVGRFGPYIRHDDKFYSLGKEDDPMEISDIRSVELIEAKRKADAERLIKSFDANPDIQILNGRWGPYIKAGTKNVKIPKGKEALSLTLEECIDLADKTPEKKSFKKVTKKTTKPIVKVVDKVVEKAISTKKVAKSETVTVKKSVAKKKSPAKKVVKKAEKVAEKKVIAKDKK